MHMEYQQLRQTWRPGALDRVGWFFGVDMVILVKEREVLLRSDDYGREKGESKNPSYFQVEKHQKRY